MKPKHAIPSKYDFMKAHSFNFIEHEKINSELIHEKNVGKIDSDFYKYGHETAEKASVSKSHEKVTAQSDRIIEDSSRTYTVAEKSEASIVTQTKTDYSGSAPKRYTTKCYIKPVTVPAWYTESLYLNIGSTRRKYEEKVYFKNKLLPYRWTESMYTEIKTVPKNIFSDIHIPVEKSDIHYISFEPQQIAAGAN